MELMGLTIKTTTKLNLCFSFPFHFQITFKGSLYDIQSINIAANNSLLCKDIEE